MPDTGTNQPCYQFATYPSWVVPLNTDIDAEDLTAIDITKFTMIFRDTSGISAMSTIGTGTFSVKRFYPGEVFYKPSPTDVASAFSGNLIITAGFPPSGSSADTAVYDPVPFQITAIA